MENTSKYEPYGLDGAFDGHRSQRPDGHHHTLIPEIAPLLSKAHPPPHHMPIFLRIVHSPWRFLRQKALAAVRTLITLYLTSILAINLFYEIVHVKHGKLYFFKAGNISLLVQVVFYWISTIWTFHHLLTPHRIRIGEDEPASGWSKIVAFFGPPKSTGPNSKRRIIFSVFYTASVTFPFLVTFIHWLVLFSPKSSEAGPSILRYFVLANVYGVTALVALFEILVLNSAHKQMPFGQHVEGLFVLTILYLIWAVLGRLITGEYVYPSLDPNYAGWRAVVTNDLALLSHTLTAFLFQRGLHGLREKATSRAEHDPTSY